MNKFFINLDDSVIAFAKSIKKLFSAKRNKNQEVITPIIEKLIDEQQVYIDVLIRLIASLKHREFELIPEGQIQLASVEIPEFFRQSRMDILYKEELAFQQAEAKITNPPDFAPMKENWQGVEVVLAPFVWHSMEFSVTGPEPSMTQMQNWYARWFDPKNRNPADKNGLHGVIHLMTAPKMVGNYWTVTIDFGSADIEAFHAFFKQLKFSGAEKVEINSAKYIRDFQLGMQALEMPSFEESSNNL